MDKLFLGILILFFSYSCINENRDKKLSENSLHIEQARLCLYENKLEISNSLLYLVDTNGLSEVELGFYFLTKGFLEHKNGSIKSSIYNIEKASNLFSEIRNEENQAEVNLIWGLIYEDTNLPSKAAESFFDGLKYYKDQDPSKIQLYLLLGLVRTAPEKNYFLNRAEEVLSELNDRNDSLLYYKAKAYIKVDIQERHLIYLKTLNDFNDLLDPRGKINLYATLALDCQILEKNDSANYYLEKAQEELNENNVSHPQLFHFFFIKAYIDMKSGRLHEAGSTIDLTIAHVQDQPGLLSQAYLRKSNIESIQKKYAQANTSLLRHLKYEKKNFGAIQSHQIALMTIRYKLNQQQFELLRVKSYWLKIVIGLLLGILILGAIILYYKQRHYKEKQALKDLISLTSAEKHELEKKYRITKDKLIEQASENAEKLKNRLLKQKKIGYDSYINNPLLKWEDFRINFNYNNPLFFDKLLKEHNELTATNLKYCACIYARLSNQQTAFLLEVSQDAVKKAKQKLRHKFQLDSVQILPNYLQSIDQSTIGLI